MTDYPRWVREEETCGWCNLSASLVSVAPAKDGDGVETWYRCENIVCEKPGNKFGFLFNGEKFIFSLLDFQESKRAKEGSSEEKEKGV